MSIPREAIATPFDIKQESEFIQACADRNKEKAFELLAQDSSLLNKRASNGSTPLMFAAESGDLELVESLLKQGAELDAVGVAAATTLWFAGKNARWGVVKLLLEKGAGNLDASPAEGPDSGSTTLWFAARGEQWEVVKLLLEKGAGNLDVSPAQGSRRGMTPLWLAAKSGQWEVVRWLLAKGAGNLDASPAEGFRRGMTPLWFAADGQQLEMMKLLLAKGAGNLDASPVAGLCEGMTMMWLAASRQQWEVVRWLLAKGAGNLDAIPASERFRGMTPLWLAAKSGQWEVVKLLLEKGAGNLDTNPGISGFDNGQKTPLWYAIEHGSDEGFRSLLAKGASLELPQNAIVTIRELNRFLGDSMNANQEQTHRNVRITFEHVKQLFALARNEAKLNAEEIQISLKKVLSALKLALNGRINGETALHVAIKNNNQVVIEALVLAGADLWLANNDAQTPQSLLPDSPLVQSFAKLQGLKGELDKLQALNKSKEVERKESKEEAEYKESKEDKEEAEHSTKKIEALIKSLLNVKDPLHRDTLYYQLGELLHQRKEEGLVWIPDNLISQAFSQVSHRTPTLHQKACGRLLHYKMMISSTSSDEASRGLEDPQESGEEAEAEISRGALALAAGRELEDPALLPYVVGRAILGQAFKPEDFISAGAARASHLEVLRGILRGIRAQFDTLSSGSRSAFRLDGRAAPPALTFSSSLSQSEIKETAEKIGIPKVLPKRSRQPGTSKSQ